MTNNAKEWLSKNALTFISNLAGASVDGGVTAVISAIVTSICQVYGENILSDTTTRSLSDLEKQKTAMCIIVAGNRIKHLTEIGQRPRKDGYFEKEINDFRPVADDIFEGSLLKAKAEYELKKVIYIGNLLANAAYLSNVTKNEVYHILSSVERLSYNHLVLLSMFHKNSINPLNLRQSAYELKDNVNGNLICLLQEIYELEKMGYVALPNTPMRTNNTSQRDDYTGSTISSGGYIALLSWHDIIVNDIVITPLGKVVINIMSLELIPEADIQDIATLLI